MVLNFNIIMEEKVIKLIIDYIKNKGLIINKEHVFIVWSCYILGNRKYLVGLDYTSTYFEVTYNVNNKEWYIDEYSKVNNICIKD
nr:MAG TPA: hypothetical protein [Crassvirales sp.]